MGGKRLFFLFFLFLVQLTNSADSSDVFLKEPSSEPYFLQEGNEGIVIPCVVKPEYFDRQKYEINWARYNNGQLRMITKNDKLLAKKHSRFILENDSATGNYSLRITEVEKNSVEGTYHCNVIGTDDSDVQYSALATVVVLVPPGDPIISTTPSESVIEGDFMTAKCVSVGGSPQPTFTWTLPNDTIASSAIFTTQFRDGATESLLHFRVTSSDDGKSVQCDVTNRAMLGGETKQVKSSQLNVLYKPVVFVTPTENLTHLSVEEGELVNLTCNSASNPPAHSYEWKHIASGERYQGKIWPIRVDSSMSGDFECRSTNELGEGTAVLKMVVQHIPRINVPESISPNEMEDIDILCEVSAVPEVIDIKWVGPNGFKQNGSRLTITSISKAQSGNYTCMATNFLTVYGHSGSQQRMGTGTTIVDVKRKPGQAQIVSARQNVDVGETIKLMCQAEDAGNPSASYTWASPSSGGIFGLEGHTEKSFEVRNAQLSDNGVYSCKAYNDLGEGKIGTVMITVIEKARISSPLATERIFTSGEQGKILECEAQGYPSPVIKWLKDGRPVKQSIYASSATSESKCLPEDFCTQTVASTLTLAGPLKWSDKGNFTCVADNGSDKTDKDSSSWTIVRVLHKPVFLNRKFPEKSLAAADIGSQAIIRCKVSARPEPEFHWMFRDSEISENERHSFHTVGITGKPDEYEQLLQIESVQESDYGEYVCRATNGNGGDHVVIELRKTSPPALPLDLQKLSATSNSVLLGWVPQFDGGADQTYVLETRKIDPFTGEIDGNAPVSKLNINAVQQDQEIDGTLVSKNIFNFTGLTPLSTYNLRIQAVSEKGESEFTPVLIASTEDVVEDANMMSPSRLVLDSSEQKINVEPKLPSDACTLLYVFLDGIWRTSTCHTSSNPIGNIIPGREYRARFCTTANGLKCSPVSKTISSGSGSVWKTNVFFPFLFFIFIGLAICVFFLVCCKTRSNPKTSKLSPIILTSLPGDELKRPADYEEPKHATFAITENETNHLSQHDAKSTKPPGLNMEYDVSTDCYLQENTEVLKNTSLSGFTNGDVLENSDEDRRIVREIIV
ncbi:B-cell receptor CD22-like [Caenorhabditis elegans]|uniref:B-cell receptor CD22-like n=1 Tax=Caenorhabditis elegans TaxID=6239 RepID=Q9TXI8_CAEEL|nr:B-cell receptor CD22-like [Caenorhabditis elegans]CCD69992.1 B-cell receptor CD22-like [Caenorhabditis elegans]|eukprot:NP_508166.1 ImmunoGlobulin-like Cell adhesion Molecule family [Caenorhabditis elegans]